MCSLSLPVSKVSELYDLLHKMVLKKKVTKLVLQCLLGKLNWAACVIRGGEPSCRKLLISLVK